MPTALTEAEIQEKSRETKEWVLNTESKIIDRLNAICPDRNLDWSFDLTDLYRVFEVYLRDLRSAMTHEGRTVYTDYSLGRYSTLNLDESIEKMTQDLELLADEINRSKYFPKDET